MKTILDRIEHQLKSFIEGSALLFRRKDLTQNLINTLIDVMRSSITTNSNGQFVAPSSYIILVNPEDIAEWQSNPNLCDDLASILSKIAQSNDILLEVHPPLVSISMDSSIEKDKIKILTRDLMNDFIDPTASLLAYPVGKEIRDHRPANAFLIIHTNQIFPLRLSVINIGRRDDNHLVIDDPRVSRNHAQIRAFQSRYILIDLNATGGTYVNGQRVTQYTLEPGDVISLAGVALIYGEESPTTNNSAITETADIRIKPPPPPG
jgi:hypothetical protein